MFANLALFPDENVTGAFISFSEMLECFHYISSEKKLCLKIVKFWIAKAGKIIKIPYFLSNPDVSNKFAKFPCFDKKMSNSIFFFAPKTTN